jgi:hypothetical protein
VNIADGLGLSSWEWDYRSYRQDFSPVLCRESAVCERSKKRSFGLELEEGTRSAGAARRVLGDSAETSVTRVASQAIKVSV